MKWLGVVAWCLASSSPCLAARAHKDDTKSSRLYDDPDESNQNHVNNNNNNNNNTDDSEIFQHFTAHDSTMTCTSDVHARPFNNQIRGVNLGGWMVLEPWITPSLFYQFLGGDVNTTAFDMYTFCQVLGAKKANQQLRHHWDAWVTKDMIESLARSGAVNSIRLPVGDFMYQTYGPYHGCVDGALDYIDDLLDWAYSAGLSVLLDVHTAKDSQNGFDNSGQALNFDWTSALSSEFAGLVTFEHWPIRDARWVGDFDTNTATYSNINYDNIQHSLKVIKVMVERYAGHPAVLGIEPLNEPWQYTPIDVLKRFYWDGYLIVKREAPYWKYIMHDSFRFDVDSWGGFMDGCPERALDTHIYQAWHDPSSRLGFYNDACRQKSLIATMEREFGPVIVGEWSLATDNCAMWLNGFNDNLPGFPRLPCKYIKCRDSYLGEVQPGVPLDPAKPLQGPYGTGLSGPSFGYCPTGRDWPKERSGNPLIGRDWVTSPPGIPSYIDDTDDVMTNLALKKLTAFAGTGHGFYFWNFRTDLYEPQWSYMEALERGWIPRGSLQNNPNILNACAREENGEFKCVLKRGQIDSAIHGALKYIYSYENATDSEEAQRLFNMTGTELREEADKVVTIFFETYRTHGATCDLGGVAMLIEQNKTLTDDDHLYLTDDEYLLPNGGANGPAVWKVALGSAGGGMVASLVAFILAMRFSRSFNERMRDTFFLKPIARSRNSMAHLVRSSINLPSMWNVDGEEQEALNHKGQKRYTSTPSI